MSFWAHSFNTSQLTLIRKHNGKKMLHKSHLLVMLFPIRLKIHPGRKAAEAHCIPLLHLDAAPSPPVCFLLDVLGQTCFPILPSRSQIKDWQSNQAALEFTRTSTWLSEQVKSTAAIRHIHCFHWTCLAVCPPDKNTISTRIPELSLQLHDALVTAAYLQDLIVDMCPNVYVESAVKSRCFRDACLFFFHYYNHICTVDYRGLEMHPHL